MSVHKNEKNNTWYVMIRYDDWKGDQHQKCKRGFKSKKEVQDWERSFKLQSAADLDMTFAAFCELYEKDIHPRLKASTWETKDNMIRKKLIPAFGKRIISEIDTKDIIAWQNELLAFRDKRKKPYSDTYLKSINFHCHLP